MTLSSASAVAFAVSGGIPSDIREWVTVDLQGQPSPYRRGFMVATEPVDRTGHGDELAAHAREVIVQELRRHQHAEPEVALGRAFAAANGVVYEEDHTVARAMGNRRALIGATAVVLDGPRATIAHVPPGQIMLIEDGLVYAIPPLESWLPHYANSENGHHPPEPLGYASWTAPHMVQTELRPGDTIVLCSAPCGRAFAQEVGDAGLRPQDLGYLYAHDPELILDLFRGMVIGHDMPRAAVAVLAFPPLSDSAQIQTVADVGRRAREEWRHARAAVSVLLPAPRPKPPRRHRKWRARSDADGRGSAPAVMTASSGPLPEDGTDLLPPVLKDGLEVGPNVERAQRRAHVQERVQRFSEWGSPKWRSTWQRPTPIRQFGVPGAHGVKIYRGHASDMGEATWRNYLPRIPLLGVMPLWLLLALALAALVLGGVYARDRLIGSDGDYATNVANVDRHLIAARELTDPDAIDAELIAAQQDLEAARDAGAPDDILMPRQQTITAGRDQANDVLRMTNVQRVGSLTAELQAAPVQIVNTPAGMFLVSGSLYRLNPDERAVEPALESGVTVDSVEVGSLFGVAVDAEGLYTTDGNHVFITTGDGTWQAAKLGEINELGPWTPGAFGAFNGNVYLLESDYRNIYRFDIMAEGNVATPADWVAAGSREALNLARDIAIDGNIHVLLSDGRVLTFNRGNRVGEIQPEYLMTGTPVTIVSGASTGYLYVAVVDDERNGRIIAFDQQGGNAYQLRLPAGFSTNDVNVLDPFAGLQDIAIDEASGTVYLVNGDGLWTAQYALPPLPEQGEATPAATPEG